MIGLVPLYGDICKPPEYAGQHNCTEYIAWWYPVAWGVEALNENAAAVTASGLNPTLGARA
jgi:hypothetical protein